MIGGGGAGDGVDGEGVWIAVVTGVCGLRGGRTDRVSGPCFREEIFEGFAAFFAFVEVGGWGQ